MQWILEHALLFSTLLFAAMMLAFEIGQRVGLAQRRRGDPERQGSGAIEGAIFALLGLLVAFTFSGAAMRFDDRRETIVEEANTIGTAWLRIDLMAPQYQPPLRAAFRTYVDLRTTYYQGLSDRVRDNEKYRTLTALQGEIWRLAVAGGSDPAAKPNANQLMLSALNPMFDITMSRGAQRVMHPPSIIYWLLAILAFGGALMGGFAMATSRGRNWFHRTAYALFLTLSVYVIIDLEFPREGFIRLDDFDEAIALSIPPA